MGGAVQRIRTVADCWWYARGRALTASACQAAGCHASAQSRPAAGPRTREELDSLVARADGLEVFHTLTRSHPPGWTGYTRRIDRDMLAEVAFAPTQKPLCMVCGPTPLVEAVATTLVDLGHPPDRVKTERFGPTGG